MIIEALYRLIAKKDLNDCEKSTTHALDWITAVALLVIGALAASGVIALAPTVAYAFIGAGVVYTLMMLIRSTGKIKDGGGLSFHF